MIKKNTAGQFIYFSLVSTTDGSAVTGASPTGYISIDGGAQGGIGGSIAEQGNGQYEYTLSQGDTNGDEIGYLFVNAGAIPVSITITTETKKMADLNDLAAGAEMDLIDDGITASKYDESTAFPVAAADTGASQIARVGADGDTLESLSDEIAALPTDADVNAQCDLALTDIHLDHLLGVDFDSGAPVGNATSFLRQMVENDAGTLRYTTNALEQAPSGTGGDATEAKQDLILEDIVDMKGTAFAKDTNSLVDLAKVTDIPDAAAIKSECDDALTELHLDHLLAVTYDPASKPGVADALLNELIENNAGVSRYTAAALNEAPSGTGGDASEANQILLLEDLVDIKGTAFAKDTNSLVDLALPGDAMNLAADAIKKVSYDESTAYPLEAADTGATEIARVGADSDTLETLSDEIAAVASSLSTTDGKVDDVDTIVTLITDMIEGDHSINTAVTPWRLLIKRVAGGATLIEKELFETDGTTDIVGTDQVVVAETEPA